MKIEKTTHPLPKEDSFIKDPAPFFPMEATKKEHEQMKRAFLEHLGSEMRKHAKRLIDQLKKMRREQT